MPLEPGLLLSDRYRIEQLHKLGSHGAVYRAADTVRNLQIAVKENLIADPPFQRQFLREADILGSLRHPSLPKVWDFLESEELGQFIVMDFIEGENLSDWITHDSLPADELVFMLAGIFDALTY